MSTASVALPRRPLRRSRVLLRRVLLALLGAALLFAAYTLWLRDSSLVAVKTVRIEGITQPDPHLQKAIQAAARGMTTLHVRDGVLDAAVRRFPMVESVSAEAKFPSTLTVRVSERTPVALIGSGPGAVAVAGDGTILRGVGSARLSLPRLPLGAVPKHPRLRGPVLEQAEILGAAPRALLRRVAASFSGTSGAGVRLADGIELRFGDASLAAEKWRAAAAVLSDPGLAPLDYVDLSVPGRPAVGGAGHLLAAPPGG